MTTTIAPCPQCGGRYVTDLEDVFCLMCGHRQGAPVRTMAVSEPAVCCPKCGHSMRAKSLQGHRVLCGTDHPWLSDSAGPSITIAPREYRPR